MATEEDPCNTHNSGGEGQKNFFLIGIELVGQLAVGLKWRSGLNKRPDLCVRMLLE